MKKKLKQLYPGFCILKIWHEPILMQILLRSFMKHISVKSAVPYKQFLLMYSNRLFDAFKSF